MMSTHEWDERGPSPHQTARRYRLVLSLRLTSLGFELRRSTIGFVRGRLACPSLGHGNLVENMMAIEEKCSAHAKAGKSDQSEKIHHRWFMVGMPMAEYDQMDGSRIGQAQQHRTGRAQ